ncbi:MAG: thiamine pyrophosphate-dependent enzyme [Marinifilaceae bacterium]|jgi:2-oxoisovalerate dehydrogenase E1 component|nr:thiamine pyrophosphate-dependent enzyme [Marinifilaceae bacterium]
MTKKYSITKTAKESLKNWFYLLDLGRKLDQKAPNYLKQAIGWSYHAPYAGHDGIQLAIGYHFKKQQDHFFPYYRDMLSCLAAGLNAKEIILNGISKKDDIASGGRHMSNHFAKPEWNIHNVSSCTGNHTLHAVGVARAMKTYKRKAVVFSSQGESSVSEGYVYEAINGASKEGLPVMFVIQDNGYGISVPKSDQTGNRKVADNFRGFKDLKIIYCNGKDVIDSMNAVYEAYEYIKKTSCPVIVYSNCVRIESHSNSDKHELYRDQNELNYVKTNDPYEKFKRMLLRYKRLSSDEIEEISKKVDQEISQAHKFAISQDDPDPKSIHDFVIPEPYKIETSKLVISKPEKIKFIQALNTTLKEEFEHNEHTFIWGQDIANKDKGGIFNVTKGMQEKFGKERVFNAPIAEDFILGTANGMSRFDEKIRIVVEGAEFADYFWPAMEQFVDSSHDYWRSNGKFSPNITIRLASGGYIGGGLYHSQTIETVLASFPGVRVVYPSYADDAAGLLRMSIRSRGITVFLEPKYLYNHQAAEAVVPDNHIVEFGKARIRNKGDKLSIVTYGNTTHMCEMAINNLNMKEQIELIDLRSLLPMDTDTIIKSLKKTSKLLIVHEDRVLNGFGAEISAQISEKAFEYLDAPIMRLGAEFTPVGFNPILEKAILPNTEKIEKKIKEIMAF